MKARFTIIVSVAALLAGSLLGYFVRPLVVGEPPKAAEEEVKSAEKRPDRERSQPNASHAADLNRLRVQIGKLERENDALKRDPGKSNLPFELRRKAGDCSRVTAGPIDLI